MKYVIAYDLGTGGIKTGIYGEDGKLCRASFLAYETFYPRESFREQRPDTWWEAVEATTRDVIEDSGIDPEEIVSLAVSGHSLGALPIGYDGKLLCEYVPVWNDARATVQAEEFFKKTDRDEWYLSNGNGFPPELYSVFKILWYKDNMPEIYYNTHKFIGTKDYINYRMTGVLATDTSYASGCGVYSLKDGTYSEKYVALSGIDRDKLPDIVDSSAVLGRVLPEVADRLGLSRNTLVCAGGVDNACMALGAGCVDDGDVYTSLGTSAWIAVCDGEPLLDVAYRPYVFAHCIPGKFVSAVPIFSAGNSLRWVRDKLFSDLLQAELVGGESSYKVIDEMASKSPVGANKLFFVPTLAGGSSMDKSPNAKGGYFGLDLMHTRDDVARATLEGIAINLKVVLEVLDRHTKIGDRMLMVGGGSKSPLWRQIFADVYDMNIAVADIGQDAGSLGAAALAAAGAGLWESPLAVCAASGCSGETSPCKERAEQYRAMLPIYERLLEISSETGDLFKNL